MIDHHCGKSRSGAGPFRVQWCTRKDVLLRLGHTRHGVPKRDSGLRLCGDYKATVNPALKVDQHPFLKQDDIFATLAEGNLFTTIDLTHAYNQVQLDDESKKYVTINMHKGLYQYTKLPFGIASAPAIFQHTMDTILQGAKGVACYIEDLIITEKSDLEHLANLEEVLKHLLRHRVCVKRLKCRVLQSSVEFLGHRVDAEGIHPLKSLSYRPQLRKMCRSYARSWA